MSIRIRRAYQKPALERSDIALSPREEQALRIRALQAGLSFESIRRHYVRLRAEWPALIATPGPDADSARVLEDLGLPVAAIRAHAREAQWRRSRSAVRYASALLHCGGRS